MKATSAGSHDVWRQIFDTCAERTTWTPGWGWHKNTSLPVMSSVYLIGWFWRKSVRGYTYDNSAMRPNPVKGQRCWLRYYLCVEGAVGCLCPLYVFDSAGFSTGSGGLTPIMITQDLQYISAL
jgi:hypothetical protein